jgi:hypothetical protein
MFFPPAAGKLHQQSLRAANVCNPSTGRLFISDRATKHSFLVDTGSGLCVFPRKLLPGRKQMSTTTSSGSTEPPFPPSDGSPSSSIWGYAETSNGAMWCRCPNPHHRCGPPLPLWSPSRLSQQSPPRRTTFLSTPGHAAPTSIPSVKTIGSGVPLNDILAEFPQLTRPLESIARYGTMR